MTKRKDKPIITKREVWKSMQCIPKKMKCHIDTAKELAKVFGPKIYNDLIIIDNNKIFVSTVEGDIKTNTHPKDIKESD